MSGDALHMRPATSLPARSLDRVDLFAAVLLCRIDDPSHPAVASLAARARSDAHAAVRTGRAAAGSIRETALRLAYEHARADAAALTGEPPALPAAPRWHRVLLTLAALRHRQRAALALFYVLGLPTEQVATVLGCREPDARRVVEAGVARLVRLFGEPVDVRRALRMAGSRVAAPEEATAAAPTAARMPRAVVRELLAPVEETPTDLITPALAAMESEPPDLAGPAPSPATVREIVSVPRRAPRPRRRSAWVAALVAVLLAALLPAGASDRSSTSETPFDPAVRGRRMAPAAEVADAAPVRPVVVSVQRGDSLWRLAEQHLGDPLRWRELWRENQGRRMSGGERFSSPHLIRPGWRLRLPDR